jgi:hypothetical protein
MNFPIIGMVSQRQMEGTQSVTEKALEVGIVSVALDETDFFDR